MVLMNPAWSSNHVALEALESYHGKEEAHSL
jgi:hypothetical protein